MPATLPPGTELPSTLMGAGWRGRAASHAEEIAEGRIWRPYGVRSAFAPLTAVLLTWPGDELAYDAPPNDMLMARRPDLSLMRVQAESIAAAYAAAGAAVHLIRPTANAPPNLVFACDLFFMTPEGAILGRMAAEQRAAEPRLCAAALAEVGVALLATPRGRATFEGADALWLAPDRVLVGVGKRTNEAGFQLVRAVLAEMGVTALAVDLPSTVQHLLGCVNPIDHDLVVSQIGRASCRERV